MTLAVSLTIKAVNKQQVLLDISTRSSPAGESVGMAQSTSSAGTSGLNASVTVGAKEDVKAAAPAVKASSASTVAILAPGGISIAAAVVPAQQAQAPHDNEDLEIVALPTRANALAPEDDEDGYAAAASRQLGDLATVASTAAVAVVGQEKADKAAEALGGIREAGREALGTISVGLATAKEAAGPAAAEAYAAAKEWMAIGSSWWSSSSSST